MRISMPRRSIRRGGPAAGEAVERKPGGTFHDRFLVQDDKELYRFGASLKDIGHQYCVAQRWMRCSYRLSWGDFDTIWGA